MTRSIPTGDGWQQVEPTDWTPDLDIRIWPSLGSMSHCKVCLSQPVVAEDLCHGCYEAFEAPDPQLLLQLHMAYRCPLHR